MRVEAIHRGRFVTVWYRKGWERLASVASVGHFRFRLPWRHFFRLAGHDPFVITDRLANLRVANLGFSRLQARHGIIADVVLSRKAMHLDSDVAVRG